MSNKFNVRLISVTPGAEKTIAYCARASSKNQNNTDITKLIQYCIKNKHWSIFELANMVVEVETSRAISAQILRHRSFCFQEFSQRYAAVDDSGVIIYDARRQDQKNRQNSIDDISDQTKTLWRHRQRDNWKRAYEDYEWALDNGVAKECARMVLPLATKTKLYMQGSIRSWMHYIDLRISNGTQKEHMDIALAIKELFMDSLPTIAEAKGWISE